MRVGLTWLSRTSRRGNMPARQGFRPASGVSEAPKTSTQAGTGIRSGSSFTRGPTRLAQNAPGHVANSRDPDDRAVTWFRNAGSA
jgi:hypothetical protein